MTWFNTPAARPYSLVRKRISPSAMRASGERSSDLELATACSMEPAPLVASAMERLAPAMASSDLAA